MMGYVRRPTTDDLTAALSRIAELEGAIRAMLPSPVLDGGSPDIWRMPRWTCPACGADAEHPDQIAHTDRCPVTIGRTALAGRPPEI